MRGSQLLGAGVLVGAVLVVGGVALLTSDHTPDPPELAERWVSGSMAGVHEPGDVVATWLTDGAVVAVTGAGTWAFDAATGERRWELPVRETGLVPCAASPAPNADGIAALLFEDVAEPSNDGEGGRCDTVGALDTRTGELLWSERLDWGPGPDHRSATLLTAGSEVITADVEEWSSHRFTLDGTALPLPVRPGSDPCSETRWIQGSELTLHLHLCEEYSITAFATQSGEELWTAPTTYSWSVLRWYVAVADAPFVVTTETGATVYGSSGAPIRHVEYEGRLGGAPEVVGGSVLVAPEEDGTGSGWRGIPFGSDPEWVHLGPEGSVPAGAVEEHVLLVSPAGGAEAGAHENREEAGGEYRLSYVAAANGKATEKGRFRTDPVIAAVAGEDTLYTITAAGTPAGHPIAHLSAYRLPG
jgi:hypothetical protein